MVFEFLCNGCKFFVNAGTDVVELFDALRSTDTCNNVFALCVDKEFAEEFVFAGCGVTGKCNAGTGKVAAVTEYHGLYVYCSTPGIRDIVHAAVIVCAGVIPGTEYGFNGTDKLFAGFGGEAFAFLFKIVFLETNYHLFKVVCVKVGVVFNPFCFFHFVDDDFEGGLRNFFNNVCVHLDETAIGVVCKALVIGDFCKTFNNFVVKTEVEDGIHHTGHRSSCAGTYGNEKRVVFIAEGFSGDFFKFCKIFIDLCFDFSIDLAAVLIILGAGFGGYGEALRNRHAEVGHFSKVCTFSAKELAHGAIAFGEKVDIFFTHNIASSQL